MTQMRHAMAKLATTESLRLPLVQHLLCEKPLRINALNYSRDAYQSAPKRLYNAGMSDRMS